MHQGSEVDLTYDRQSFDRLLDDVEKSSTSEIGPFFLVRMTMVTKIITENNNNTADIFIEYNNTKNYNRWKFLKIVIILLFGGLWLEKYKCYNVKQ